MNHNQKQDDYMRFSVSKFRIYPFLPIIVEENLKN
jgi:hypothetical protein